MPKRTAKQLSKILSSYLDRSDDGQNLVNKFNDDRPAALDELSRFLRTQLAEDPALAKQIAHAFGARDGKINSTVIDSQVDEIINIAALDQLNLTHTKQYFLFRNVKQLLVAIISVVVVIFGTGAGGYVYYRMLYLPSLEPDVMTGDFNIAVAQFGEILDDGEIRQSKRTLNFMYALCNYLDSEYSTSAFSMDVQTTHRKMPVVLDDQQAGALAKAVNANLVLYGTVYFDDEAKEGTFRPRFYVSKYKDQGDLEEVVGYNKLEHPIRFSTSYSSGEEMNAILSMRAAILTNFTRGLVFVSADNIRSADQNFREAVKQAELLENSFEEQTSFKGQEVLYLMLAFTQRKLENYDQALENLNKALTLNSEYARAYIGLGNNYYQLAVQDWGATRTINPELLNRASAEYQRALTAVDRPLSAFIEEKVSIGLGNVLFRRGALSEQERWQLFQQAADYYYSVARRYEKDNDLGMARLASSAYYNIGYIEEIRGNHEQAKSAYQHCAEIDVNYRFKALCAEELKNFD